MPVERSPSMGRPAISANLPPVSGQLHRALRLPHATALVVGTIIGSAVFVQASEVTHHVPNILGVLLV
jgi:hypothetical protein